MIIFELNKHTGLESVHTPETFKRRLDAMKVRGSDELVDAVLAGEEVETDHAWFNAERVREQSTWRRAA